LVKKTDWREVALKASVDEIDLNEKDV